jgi:predicted DNA-binding ribbon-helix-helix protein
MPMCRVFAEQSAAAYAYQTRSVRLGGHATSIRLEGAFWAILEEVAAAQQQPLAKFLTQLHDEVLNLSGESHNFTSLLRCACLTYVSDIKRDGTARQNLTLEAARAGGLRPPHDRAHRPETR